MKILAKILYYTIIFLFKSAAYSIYMSNGSRKIFIQELVLGFKGTVNTKYYDKSN